MQVNSINFGAYTDNGNKYNRTKIAKIAGAALGATVGAYGLYKGAHSDFITKRLPLIKTIAKYSFITITMIAATAVGATLGGLVDGIINKSRQNKADKLAENKKVQEAK